MFNFEKLSAKQILVFSDIVSKISLPRIDFIKTRYLNSALNFEVTLDFLKELNLIKLENGNIIPTHKYQLLLSDLKIVSQQQETVNRFIIDHLFVGNTQTIFQVKEFLAEFNCINNKFEFTPDIKQRIKYSGVRNFLLEIGAIDFDQNKGMYIIIDRTVSDNIKNNNEYHISPEEFIKTQEGKKEIARLAELEIIKYEEDRLVEFPDLTKNIEHIATKNIAAGYDIKSFSGEKPNESTPIYIEVKAVSISDYWFNWSRNEIEQAKLHKQNYNLYLLPVISSNKFDFANLKIIKNPYSNIYNNKNEWIRTEELLSFSLKKTHK